jgi:septum formation protein
MEPIILASGSLRRQEYFRLLGLQFSIMPAPIDETFEKGADPKKTAEELSLRKVNKIIEILDGRRALWIVGADTLISVDGHIFGKPENREDAKRMLQNFQGRDQEVITAVTLFNGKEHVIDCRSVTSTVTFAPLRDSEIEWYLNTGEWQGAAGAYKIQGLASCFISNIRGSYSSIVGLPLRDFYVMLKENGYPYGDIP